MARRIFLLFIYSDFNSKILVFRQGSFEMKKIKNNQKTPNFF